MGAAGWWPSWSRGPWYGDGVNGFPAPPTHAPNGSPVVGHELTAESQDQMVRYAPRLPPGREVPVEFDDDGEVLEWRALTDDEFAEAMRRYEAFNEEYHRTGGMRIVSNGPPIVRVRVTCKDGTVASATWTGDAWRWTDWAG